LALGKAVLAGATGEQAALRGGAVAEGDAEVAEATQTVVGAVRVLAAEGTQVIVHRSTQPNSGASKSSCQAVPVRIEQRRQFGNPMGTPPKNRRFRLTEWRSRQ